MEKDRDRFSLNTGGLRLEASLAPWDGEVLGFGVAQITQFKILDTSTFDADFAVFSEWARDQNCGLVSCRLGMDKLRELMLLEAHGFRFIETVMHPVNSRLAELDIADQGVCVLPAEEMDLPALCHIAETAFGNERFHVDPRIPAGAGGRRYGRWVIATPAHPRQRLLKIAEDGDIFGFFIIEDLLCGRSYWHLAAIAPWRQGKGHGRRAWLSMLRWHRLQDRREVATTISSRNVAVLNLYASLNFRFEPPEMTFHWMRTAISKVIE